MDAAHDSHVHFRVGNENIFVYYYFEDNLISSW